ncbi:MULTISPECIES: hypothetical protein [Pseudomonas]|uniref:Uncharacterized protein n=1 Tax=Pseudomonas oryzihabitans TaxID=47885 RepID=A0A1G5PG27_9PSED|nr:MULTISPECIES: hypothetical protein [Pseudomonas]KXJ33192.1 hypothetical protein AX284_08365 [Pseudomonas sp. HUK17]NMY92496.1 hypothetical protein [Pseudomonas psychrotolerans]SCZ48268.1 hypothetical protein SAMN05216279_12219 [Pseudomonas psychrotolerans]
MSTDPRQKIEHLIRLSAGTTGFQGRTVRLDNGHIALCTSTYNYSQDDETRHLVAERIALLWNLARSIPTDQLSQLALLPRPRT